MRKRERKYLLIPRQLLTPSVFLVSLAWMLMLHLLSYWNNAGIAPAYQRIIVHIVIHAIPFALAGLLYLTLRKRINDRHLTLVLVAAVIIGSAVRGIAQFHGLNLISSRALDDLLFRVAASTTNTGFAVLIAWAGFSAVESHRHRKERLLENHERLLLLRREAKQKFEQMDASAAEEIRASLLATLESQAKDASSNSVSAMRQLIDDVVRPLSHYFVQRDNGWLPPEPEKRLMKIDWQVALGKAFHANNVHLTPLFAMLIWTSLPNNVFNRGPLIAFVAIIHLLVFYPVFVALKRLAARISWGRSRAQQAFIFFITLYVGGQALGLSSWVYTRLQEPQFIYALIGPVWTLVGGALIAFAKAAMAESESIEDALLETESELRWSLARAREMHRQQRRALAHALHGQVQAAVASTILRLELSSRKADVSREAAEEIVESLKSQITNVDLLSSASEPVSVVLERISDTWVDIASIHATVSDAIVGRLEVDPVSAIALNDVLTELTYNSIKHGSASEVTIALESADENVLHIVVSDNGSLPNNAQGRGLGSALLDDCAISWERTRLDGRTVTAVQLPIA